jgi:hypothetical protein
MKSVLPPSTKGSTIPSSQFTQETEVLRTVEATRVKWDIRILVTGRHTQHKNSILLI